MRGEAELSAPYEPGLDTANDPEHDVNERLAQKLGLTPDETNFTHAHEVVKAYVFGTDERLSVVLVGFPRSGGLEVPSQLEDPARERLSLLLRRAAPQAAVTYEPRDYMWSG